LIGYSRSQYLHELVLSTAFFGYGFGLINVGQNLLILRGSSEGRRRQLLSGLHSTYAVASLMAPLVVGFLTDNGWGWRNGFEAFAFLGILGLIVTLFAKDDIDDKVKSDAEVLHRWKKWMPFGVVISLYVASEVVLSSRFVLLNRRAFNATEAEAVLRLAGLFALLFIGRLGFTFFSFSKWSSKNIILVALALSIGANLLGLYFSHWFLVLCGLTMAPIFGVGVEYMALQFGKEKDRVISMVLAFSGLFIVAIHWFVGVLSDIHGIRDAMLMGPILMSVSFVWMCFLPSDKGAVNA
ncbi:MAG: MFS transporter, partial [Croceitalea sp.]|nr:MFS transporter [Croceitalea sp.]